MIDNQNYKKVFQQRIDEVLFYVWDPIGVNDTPQARDEYSAYVDDIFQAIADGQSKEAISAMLTAITTDKMGLHMRVEHDDKVAALLLDWDEFFKSDLY